MATKLSPQMAAALRHIESNLNSFGWCVRFYGHSTNTLAALVRRGLVERNPEAAGQLRPVAITVTPTTVDIPAAVRDYVDAERSGAGIITQNVAQAGIVTALQSADPKLSDTAAERRFRKLVAEAVAANDGLPLNVVTKSTAETLALLQSISDAAEV